MAAAVFVTTFVIKVVVFQLVVGLDVDHSALVFFPAMARASPGCLTKMKSYREAIRPP